MNIEDRLIVALDVHSVHRADEIVTRIGDRVSFYKIGLEMICSGWGLDFARQLRRSGKRVFLDMKLHDIGNTVERAVKQIVDGEYADFLTVHAYPQTMRAAVAGRGESPLKLFGVTVLTSYTQADIDSAGYNMNLRNVVGTRTDYAMILGMDGVVCGADEAKSVRNWAQGGLEIITPGIRLEANPVGDQRRITTPQKAIASGVNYIVVGRPITEAPDYGEAVETILASMRQGITPD